MPQTVIRFQQDAQGVVRFHLEQPPNWPNHLVQVNLPAGAGQAPATLAASPLPAGAVVQAGQALALALRAHPAIQQQLDALLNPVAVAGVTPIGLQVESELADSLPWEALFDNNEFLCLRSVPVARLIAPRVMNVQKNYVFQPPLRVALVLGASGATPTSHISAADEWESMARAIASVKPPLVLPLHVLVLVAESALETAIKQAALPGVHVLPITDRAQLTTALREFRPNLLHFFCHGVSEDKPHLRVSTVLDWDSPRDGSIVLEAADLRQEVDPNENVWLIVLNCCDSAAAGPARAREVRNLAVALMRKGFPAALGMREAVEATNARLLSEELYKEVFAFLGRLPGGQDPREVEWASLVISGRRRLTPTGNPAAAANAKEWTIPAVYMRTEPFLLRRLDPRPTLTDEQRANLRAEIKNLEQQRDQAAAFALAPDLKGQMLDEFNAKIAALYAQLA